MIAAVVAEGRVVVCLNDGLVLDLCPVVAVDLAQQLMRAAFAAARPTLLPMPSDAEPTSAPGA